MITGSLVQRPSSPNSEPLRENEQKLFVLLKLGSHYWPRDFTPKQAESFLADYIEDLANVSAAEVAMVAGEWRRRAENTRFPRSGEILKMVSESRYPDGRPRLQTFRGYTQIEGRRATKSAAQILAEHGLKLPEREELPPLPGATDLNGPVTDELKNSALAQAALALNATIV